MGAAAALSDTDAEYTLGTSDFMVDGIAHIKWTSTASQDCYIMWCNDGAVDWYFHVRRNYIGIWIDGGSYMSPLISGVNERKMHPVVFCDRSGNAYYYLNGEYIGATDISAKVASDLDGTVLNCGGVNGANQRCDTLLQAKMHKFSGTFPTSDERAAIAMERYLNPDAESPTLAARTNHATERRVDVTCEADQYTATTVDNDGTGGDFTIGGGLQWYEVRTVAERCGIDKPTDDWRCFDVVHEATVTADLGGVSGEGICEIIYCDLHKNLGTVTDELMEIDAGGGDYFKFITSAPADAIYLQSAGNGNTTNVYLRNTGHQTISLRKIHVAHMYYSPSNSREKILIDGQVQSWMATAGNQDMSGNIDVKFGDATQYDGIMAIRFWNASSGLTALDDVLRERATNPWTAPTTLAGATLLGNWECRIDASVSQGASSTVLKNLANPGTGDLTISGAGTIGNSTTLAVRGA